MSLNEQQKNIEEMCKNKLPLSSACLSEDFYYDSLVFCLIDAIFSIGVRYAGTANTVIRYCDYFKLNRIYDLSKGPSDKHTICDLINNKYLKSGDYGASEIYRNRQRTSSRNGILKAEAVYKAALVLNKYGIDSISDIRECENIESLEKDFRKINGQRSGISFSYLLMLSGNDDNMKIDRMLTRFYEVATGSKEHTVTSIYDDYKAVCKHLVDNGYPNLTPRLLDHEIWKYAKAHL